ncbi:hypothetical protein IEQ34_026821 [Dendrobium chrysotoxum]|uniref:Uncharacterized protein n=1 Tax=Dendrobium chrysotoxum TaxID=161865 RepID=A0AAV7FLC1_DENCH|nr:hypothetical protein IEQ34_026821 [Dendrobium chrysotoxum]
MWSEFIRVLILSHTNYSGIDYLLKTYGAMFNPKEKWRKLNDLLIPLIIGVEDILNMLNILDVDTLHNDVCYTGKYVEEEYLFKVELSTQTERSYAIIMKKYPKFRKQMSTLQRTMFRKHCKTGIEVEGFTPSQASDDPLSDSGDDDDIEIEFRKFFSSDDEVVEIM